MWIILISRKTINLDILVWSLLFSGSLGCSNQLNFFLIKMKKTFLLFVSVISTICFSLFIIFQIFPLNEEVHSRERRSAGEVWFCFKTFAINQHKTGVWDFLKRYNAEYNGMGYNDLKKLASMLTLLKLRCILFKTSMNLK